MKICNFDNLNITKHYMCPECNCEGICMDVIDKGNELHALCCYVREGNEVYNIKGQRLI